MTETDRPEIAVAVAGPRPPAPSASSASDLLPVLAMLAPWLAVGAMTLLAYTPEFRWLLQNWGADPNYSHGYLVPVVAGWIYWTRRNLAFGQSRPWQPGWLLLLASLGFHAYAYQGGRQWTASLSLLTTLAALALTFGGTPALRRAWPSVAYLVFMIPLPQRLNDVVAQPLQALASEWSTAVLQLIGIWAIAEGNVIYIGRQPLNVAEACNGLSMMMTLMATVVAAVILLPISAWIRALLIASAAPIALASNVLRIVATGWCVQRFGFEAGGKMGHDLAGWLMMPLSLLFVGLELIVLLWLVAEESVVLQPTLLGKPLPAFRSRRSASEPSAAAAATPPSEDVVVVEEKEVVVVEEEAPAAFDDGP